MVAFSTKKANKVNLVLFLTFISCLYSFSKYAYAACPTDSEETIVCEAKPLNYSTTEGSPTFIYRCYKLGTGHIDEIWYEDSDCNTPTELRPEN
jgi:hypothetical protein